MRRLCKNALDDLGVAEECVSDIELAVTEACTNVLQHAHGSVDVYETTVEITDTDCTIRVIDSGEEDFDPSTSRSEEDLAGSESGRGILLIKALVDNVRFISRPEEGTIVHLEKNLVLKSNSVLNRLAAAPA